METLNKFHKTIKWMIHLILLGTFFSGCENMLEPEYPNYLLSNEAVLEDSSTIDAALAQIYSGLRDQSPMAGDSQGLGCKLGLYTDELLFYRTNPDDTAFFHHVVQTNTSTIANYWNNSYALIYNVNAIIEGLEQNPLTKSETDPFLGEALFLRAYLHFYLAELYGDIPYVKTTDYTVNASVSRMPLEIVQQEITADLSKAKSLLPNIDKSGKKLRAYKTLASAMLARQYLYLNLWQKAFEESNEVISSGIISWESDLNQVFLKESSSTIWQLIPQVNGRATEEGITFIFESGPPTFYSLTDSFMDGFEEGDLRRKLWTREISDGTQSWFHPYKYKQRNNEASSSEYAILFRLAEQYLIRAEASLKMGNLQMAKDDIDIIRRRAGLESTKANTSDEIMNEILRQRKYELFTEQGHRWFDLKRTSTAEQVLAPIKTNWKATNKLFPLPQKELLLNPTLKPQNPGY